MDLQSIWSDILSWSGENKWIVQVFLVVFVALFASFVQKRLLRRLHQRLKRTETPWDDALIDALRRPLTWLIWLIGISFAADIVYQETQAAIFTAVGPIRDVGVVSLLAWFLVRLVSRVQENLIERHEREDRHYDRTTIDAIGKLLRASIVITAGLVILQTLGFSISGVLAFGGIGGIAVGFAAKDLLANFFGALTIYLDRPFEVGDWIRSPDREIEGTVEHIGWRLTRIRTFDKRPIYVPNAVFANIAVENPQRMTHRRIYETIGIRYDDIGKMDAITREVKEMLENHPEIDTGQTLMVNFNAFGPSSVDFFVYTFTKTTVWTRYHEIKQDVLLKIAAIIEKHGAEIAFPTRTLHLPDGVKVLGEPAFAGLPPAGEGA